MPIGSRKNAEKALKGLLPNADTHRWGTSRSVYLGPDNVVYKVNGGFQTRTEIAAIRQLAAFGIVWVPPISVYKFSRSHGQETVLAMPKYAQPWYDEWEWPLFNSPLDDPENRRRLEEMNAAFEFGGDIAPKNIGLDENGHIVLLDLGIIKARHVQSILDHRVRSMAVR